MSFQDKELSCSDCGAAFTFGAGEQELFASKGYTNEPKRCPACRATRKQSVAGSGTGGYGNRSYGSAPRQMFPATCAQCGKNTQVPFEPRGDRPVYCSDCYNKVRVNR